MSDIPANGARPPPTVVFDIGNVLVRWDPRNLYRKIEVESRTQAVLWGVRHGFTPDHHRIDHWKGGP